MPRRTAQVAAQRLPFRMDMPCRRVWCPCRCVPLIERTRDPVKIQELARHLVLRDFNMAAVSALLALQQAAQKGHRAVAASQIIYVRYGRGLRFAAGTSLTKARRKLQSRAVGDVAGARKCGK